jgi:hypothetical protein
MLSSAVGNCAHPSCCPGILQSVPNVDTTDLLGTAEAAEFFGVDDSNLHRWRRRGVVLPSGRRVLFPEPVLKLRATPVWDRSDLERLRDALGEPATVEPL